MSVGEARVALAPANSETRTSLRLHQQREDSNFKILCGF